MTRFEHRAGTAAPRRGARPRCAPPRRSHRPATGVARSQPLQRGRAAQPSVAAPPNFFEYSRASWSAVRAAGAHDSGGLRVVTTLDPRLQRLAKHAISGQLAGAPATRRRGRGDPPAHRRRSARWRSRCPGDTAAFTSQASRDGKRAGVQDFALDACDGARHPARSIWQRAELAHDPGRRCMNHRRPVGRAQLRRRGARDDDAARRRRRSRSTRSSPRSSCCVGPRRGRRRPPAGWESSRRWTRCARSRSAPEGCLARWT